LTAAPEISVVVSTYQRPWHLRRCLASLAVQQGVAGGFEVIVVDDGSQDDTPQVIADFRREAAFPVKFCTHPHEGFQLARCRNAGIRASTAPYLLFTDGDCVFPPDHLAQHLAARRPGVARAGDCIRIDQETSSHIDEAAVRSGSFLRLIDRRLERGLRRAYLKSLGYQFVRHATRPKLVGWNMAVWRDALDRVNGFDEQFRGWGCEDDDLAARLRRGGVRVATVLGYTRAYHLWHPPHQTTPQLWHDGPNVAYFQRPLVLTRCLEGIRRRSLFQVSTRVTGSPDQPELTRALSATFRESTSGPELELLVWPNQTGFACSSACRVLITWKAATLPAAVERQAHAIVRRELGQGAAEVVDALQTLVGGRAVEAAPSVGRRAA
jgi:glycosyltransferase involved in cell wall biosynthesis